MYIDSFPLDAIGTNKEDALKKLLKFDWMNMFLMMRRFAVRKERAWYKNISIYLARLIPSCIVNEKRLSINLDKFADSLNDEENNYIANLNGAYRKKEVVNKSILGKPTLYIFEDIQIYGPEYCDEYLTGIYGDWRKLPPVNKRKTVHDFIEINLDKSYITR